MIYPRVYSESERQRMRSKRLYTEGSELLTVTISNLAASAQKLYGFSTDATIRKYLPLNYIRIFNDSSCNLKVYVNNSSTSEPILKNTIWTYEGNFNTFLLENMDTENEATGTDIYCTVQRKPLGG